MTRILITSNNSYIGNHFEQWLTQYPNRYEVDKISVREDLWINKDFAKYDVILHVAAVVHKKETEKNKEEYYKVNRDLTIQIAQKAKQSGVGRFIFLSSMSVYGIEVGVIDKNTIPRPKTYYGRSKFEAENSLLELENKEFSICIIRSPMVYGKNCPGNYGKISKLARITPIFPDIKNQRSMIYIDHLSEFIRFMMENKEHGCYFPQNKEYVSTKEIVQLISRSNGRKVCFTKIFNVFIRNIKLGIVNKVFGDLMYDMEMSKYRENYCVRAFEETIIGVK